jgi:WhiB family redox-sensing transcriptional regulator
LQTDAALCRQVGLDLFFPEQGESSRPAKAICARCELSVECAAYALTHHLRGVWGGTNETDRERIRSNNRRTA